MASMDQLYQTLIIEHDRSPRNFRTLEAPTHLGTLLEGPQGLDARWQGLVEEAADRERGDDQGPDAQCGGAEQATGCGGESHGATASGLAATGKEPRAASVRLNQPMAPLTLLAR